MGLAGKTLAAVLALLFSLGLGLWYWPQPASPYADYLLPDLNQGGSSGLSLAWGGVSSVLISDGQTTLAIDPFYSRPEGVLKLALNQPLQPSLPAIEKGLERAGISQVDAVLVSHAHYDHSMDAGLLAQRHAARLLGGPSVMQIGVGAGLPAAQRTRVEPGQSYQVGAFQVRFFASVHAGATGGYPTGVIEQPLQPPQGYAAYKLGQVWSILIEHPAGSILHHGSAGFVPGELRAAALDVDLLLLGIALVKDWPAYLDEVVDASGAHTVIPLHWDNFLEPFAEPLRPMPLVVDLPAFFGTLQQQRPQLRIATLPPSRSVAAPLAAAP